MEEKNTRSAMSVSLFNRDVYCVCFPERDGMDSLSGEFAKARKQFFTGGKKAVKVGKAEIIKGFDGKLHGRLSRRGFYWKKSTGRAGGGVTLEEAFDQKAGRVVVKRDFRGVIVSRTFFDKDQRWVKSEYYEPWDSLNARVSFKPSDASDMVERFDREPDGKHTRSTELFPLPYLAGTAEQSILNARFGEPRFIVSTAEGDFCYCPQRETELRKQALAEIQNGTIVLMPAWEVRDGAFAGDEGEEQTNVTFTSLEEYARIEPEKGGPQPEAIPEQAEAPAGPFAADGGEEFTPAPEQEESQPESKESQPMQEEALPEQPDEPSPSEEKTEDELILEAARRAAQTDEALETTEDNGGQASQPESALDPLGYRGDIRDGKIAGRGRTEQQNGLTAYDGEYRDGKREGFGSYYYKNGNLCYAGSWKDDKREGLGVSFRDGDHALHIANWKEGQPGSFVSLFDKDGNLRYGGRIEDGKKQGAGVSFNQADGTVFVGKWEDGQPTGVGSAFDRDGNLLYYGGWKNGLRSGQGTEFDKNGGIVFDGEWKDGKYHNGILYQKLPQTGMEEGGVPSWDL